MGASASLAATNSSTEISDEEIKKSIKCFHLSKITRYIRVFRNLENGDILFLVDDDIDSTGIEDSMNWQEQNLSRFQQNYLESCSLKILHSSTKKLPTINNIQRSTSVEALQPDPKTQSPTLTPSRSNTTISYLFGLKDAKISPQVSRNVPTTSRLINEKSNHVNDNLKSSYTSLSPSPNSYQNMSQKDQTESTNNTSSSSDQTLASLNEDFIEIDQKLKPVMIDLTLNNHREMKDILAEAIQNFETKMQVNERITELAKRIYAIKYDNLDKHEIDNLKSDIVTMREALKSNTFEDVRLSNEDSFSIKKQDSKEDFSCIELLSK